MTHIWHAAVGEEELSKRFKTLIEDYLSSGEKQPVIDEVRELKTPLYCHELVQRLLVLAVHGDNGIGDSKLNRDAAFELCKELEKQLLLTKSQFEKGLKRVKRSLEDLTLDVPKFPELLNSLEIRVKSLFE